MDMQQIKRMILKAKKAGACQLDLAKLRKCTTVEEVLGRKEASYWAYWYALHVLRGRFPEGEAVIAQDFYWSHHYASDVLKGRFEQGEAAIAQDAYWSYRYASEVLHGRFLAGEEAISRHVDWRYMYHRLVPGAPELGNP